MSKYNYAVIGDFGGLKVIESPYLPWNVIYKTPTALVCGETQHLRHLIKKAAIFADMRADLQRQLDAFAMRVGVDRSTVSE